MKIYRKHAALILSAWKGRGRAFIEVVPAMEKGGGGTELTAERYDCDSAIRISFDQLGMLKVSYRMIGLAYGSSPLLEQDKISIVAVSTSDKDKVLAVRYVGGDIDLSFNHGSKTFSILLERDELYAIGMWFQFQALCFIMRE